MLHIHQLSHLNIRNASLESVYILRELRQKTPYPFSVQPVASYLSEFFLAQLDHDFMQQALGLIPSAVERLQLMLSRKDSLHEPFNIQRAIQILQELPPVLQQNIAYVEEILPWQDGFVEQFVAVLNKIPQLRTPEEKAYSNQQLNALFQTMLCNKEFAFNFQDVVNEAHLAHIVGLSESMGKGFLFHITLEEELKKIPYPILQQRLPASHVAEVEEIRSSIERIRKGVERAYDANMRMVQLSVVMYAYVKWMLEKA